MPLDLSTNYGGLQLRSPIVVGASPMCANTQTRTAIENAGAGAIVLPSLFEEHVIAWHAKNNRGVTEREEQLLQRVNELTHETLLPNVEAYLDVVNRASTLCSIPVIASLNGRSDGNWLEFASELQGAGADAIELNVYHGPLGQLDSPRDVEDRIVEVVRQLRQFVSVPLFLKLGREYTCVGNLARRLVSGLQGLVLFARDPEIDIRLDDLRLNVEWGLSTSGEISSSIKALMNVRSHCPAIPLAGSGGIARPDHVIKMLLAGADVAMITSALYRDGPDIIRTMVDGLTQFMEGRQIKSLYELQSLRPLPLSSEEDRLSLIAGLTGTALTDERAQCQANALCDRWGHTISRA